MLVLPVGKHRSKSRRTAHRIGRAVAIASLGAVLVGATTVAATAQASGSVSGGTKPTIVLVHGAWADSSGWDSEITKLTGLGFPVVTVADPLRGLTSDSDYVRSRLAQISGPIVLVGHSYGGAIITNAARDVPNVKALVYLAGFALAEGESVATISSQYPSHIDSTRLDIIPVPNPVAPNGQDVDLYIKPAYFADIFAADVSAQQAALQAATQRPLSNTAFTQPSGAPAWTTIPSWDLITLDDNAVTPAAQAFMAARMNAHSQSVHSAHDVMISHPDAVDRIILQAAASIV
jgi:pimeloyl-ACP methyl ester carboxylesterase